jgi:hypothetical protein
LLKDYVRTFMDDRKDDPTGYETLKKTLAEGDMAAFQARWEKLMLGLKFP